MAAATDEALPAGDTAEQGLGAHTNSSNSIVVDLDADRKARLVARLASKGYALQRMADGTLMVSRWSLSKPLDNIESAEGFARQVGAV